MNEIVHLSELVKRYEEQFNKQGEIQGGQSELQISGLKR